MANRMLFQNYRDRRVPPANARNEAGGRAHRFAPKHALAQYASTGCMNSTFYASADEQLETVLKLAESIEPAFVAKTAIHARKAGHMKDMPALLCAVLASRDVELLEKVFPRVIDNARMLRNFVQILRSGVTGRKSLGTAPRRMVREWLEARTDEEIFRGSVGADPSLADIVRMTHPRPATESREALYGRLIGRPVTAGKLPEIVRQYDAFKLDPTGDVPNVPFQMLTSMPLEPAHWMRIARNAGWQMTRMNLNTFARHGVFENAEVMRIVARRLRDADAIHKARVFPYQLMAAWANAYEGIPPEIREALQDAMEIATRNVPRLPGKTWVCVDVSGSMGSPVTGHRKGSTSAIRCVDVAALFAASILRRNREAEVLPFAWDVNKARLNPRDTITTNTERLMGMLGGGTDCSAPLKYLNKERAKGDTVIYVSDSESWVDANSPGRATGKMAEWAKFQGRNPGARLVCIDIQPYGTSQAPDREDILNIGGFSDRVFEVIHLFATGKLSPDHQVGVIEAVDL